MAAKKKAASKTKAVTPQEICRLLDLKGWKQLDLANELRVSKSSVWRWIEGHGQPIPSFQDAIRRLLAEASAQR